jgi:ABC-type nitrate/sulfonate/bicarbonate transport system ATPase subunit
MNIKLKNITFGYDSFKKVLNNVSFCVTSGEIVVILGTSGCGKTTLLKLIAGLIEISENNYLKGDILIDGNSPKDNLKMGRLSFMFQEHTLFPFLNVVENIELPLKIRKSNGQFELLNDIFSSLLNRDSNSNGKKISRISSSLIDSVGLTSHKNYYPAQLSGGMKTRAALARTFITNPSLLLLDEPFSSLDINWKTHLYSDLIKLKSLFNSTIILVTHDINEALILSNHIIILDEAGYIKEEIITDNKLPDLPKDMMLQRDELYNKTYEILLSGTVR